MNRAHAYLAGTAAIILFAHSLIAQDGDFDVIWLATEPSGAAVAVNGEDRGATPIFIGGLEAGSYTVSVSMPGYLTEQLQFNLPTPDATQRLVRLKQRPGTCLITSTPSGASIAHGTQLLGRTPLVISTLPAGSHELRVLQRGFREAKISVMIDPDRATNASAQLASDTGTVTVATIPAAASVLLDNYDMGEGTAIGDDNKSAPRSFDGLPAGTHKFEIEYKGVRGKPQSVAVEPGSNQTLLLMLWYPDVVVETNDGKSVTGMIIQQSDTDLVVAKTLTDHVRINRADVAKKDSVNAIEARRLAREAADR